MNKKIKQFSEQAVHDDNGETLHFLPAPRYIKKFSKLILEEALDIVKDEVSYINDSKTAEDVVKIVRLHFGIE
jgi:hypothetical protein